MATARVVSLGTNREMEIPDGCTVQNLLQIADLSPDLEVRINGQAASADTPVAPDSTVVASAPSVKHG